MQGLRHHSAASPRPRVKYGLTVGTVGHHLGKSLSRSYDSPYYTIVFIDTCMRRASLPAVQMFKAQMLWINPLNSSPPWRWNLSQEMRTWKERSAKIWGHLLLGEREMCRCLAGLTWVIVKACFCLLLKFLLLLTIRTPMLSLWIVWNSHESNLMN